MPAMGFFWPAYLISLIHTLLKFNLDFLKKEKINISILIIFIILKIIQAPTISTLLFTKTFLGFYFFYYYFKYFNKTEFDKILISFVISYSIIEFFFKVITHSNEFARRWWAIAYPRPLGIGENATVTSVILISFFLCLKKDMRTKLWNRLFTIALIISGSGVGYFGLIYIFIERNLSEIKKIKLKLLIITFFILIFYSIFFHYMGPIIYKGNPLYKISPKYISFLFSYKSGQLMDIFTSMPDKVNLLIGYDWGGSFAHVGDDFGWRDIFLMSGLIGIALNLFLLTRFVKIKQLKFFLIISLFHYGSIWWPAGQIFLGYIIGSRHREELLS